MNDFSSRASLATPLHARTALDVGCGEGFAARALAARGLAVTGVDPDAPSLALAREQDCAGITYLEADVMTAELPSGYDVVTILAVLHHLPMEAALERVKTLLAPGGTLLVVGLAASDLPRDAGWELAAVIAHRPDHGGIVPRHAHPCELVARVQSRGAQLPLCRDAPIEDVDRR